MIFHIDANSFYASCEHIFRPDLRQSPIAVLTNNDGVVIALDQKCKDLGLKRGDIYFKEKYRYQAFSVKVFSSNYTLYADISTRLNTIYNYYAPETEMYSIDESFLFFPDWINCSFTGLAKEIRNAVLQQVHVPVSIGIAPTKTLAKLCNKLAKRADGVFNWQEADHRQILSSYPAADVWGIGPAKAELLASRFGIHTALAVSEFPLDKAKKYLSINGFRTIQELNGIPAIDDIPSRNRQNITVSRSFAHGVRDLAQIETALAEYTQLAVARMRSEHSCCRIVSIYLMTARAYTQKDAEKEYFNGAMAEFNEPSDYLPDILSTAKNLVHRLYRPQYNYRKVMVNLFGLEPGTASQLLLFSSRKDADRKKQQAVMQACDDINRRFGRGTIHPGLRSQTNDIRTDGTKADWIMHRGLLSPDYTTSLDSLPEVN